MFTVEREKQKDIDTARQDSEIKVDDERVENENFQYLGSLK